MAQQQQQRPPGVVGRVLGKDDPDSVDLEFGNEYSEETLNILRMIDRPAYLEETSSLDPVDDLSQYVEHQLALPPAAYDTLQDVGQDQLRELERLGKEELDPAAQDAIRYRQRLAQGASHQDLTWLKLRAYHRAMDKLALADQQERRQVEAQRLQEYEVPTDRVPPELLHLTPAQLAARQRLAVAAEQRAKQRRDAVQRILAAPEPSEESEWAVPPKQLQGSGWQLPPWAQEGVRLALAQHLEGGWRLLAPAAPGAAPADEAAAAASTSGRAGQEHEGAAAGRQERRQLRTIYTQVRRLARMLRRRCPGARHWALCSSSLRGP